MKVIVVYRGPEESKEFSRPTDRVVLFKRGVPTEIDEDEDFIAFLLADHMNMKFEKWSNTKRDKENGL